MPKAFCILLCFTLLLSMAGCRPSDSLSSQSAPTTSSTQITPDNAPDAPLHTFFALSVPNTTEYFYHDDGTMLFEYGYQYIQLYLADQTISDKITLDFLNRIDATRSNAQFISQQSASNYTGNAQWSAYKHHIRYSPTRVDQGVISLFGTKTTYTGGLHPDQKCISVSYDATTGDYLTLGSVLNHIDNKNKICELVISELDKVSYQYSLFDGYEEVVAERFSADESTDEAFYFTDTGLVFYFAPYELAPYSAGIITVEIPYTSLPGILNDAFFPDEYQPATGTLIAVDSQSVDTGLFSQIIETVIAPEGRKILLYSDKTIRNLTITQGSWTPDGLYYLPEFVIFRSTGVSNDKAISIQVSIPEILPDLMLSYDTKDGTKHFYISKSKSDGSVLLLPAD